MKRLKKRTKSLDVLRACKISERGGIWKKIAGVILLPRLNKLSISIAIYLKVFREDDAIIMVSRATGSTFVLKEFDSKRLNLAYIFYK